MIFVKQTRPVIIAENNGLNVLDIMKEVGKRWRELGSERKAFYAELSRLDKFRHQDAYAQFEKELEKYNLKKPSPPVGSAAARRLANGGLNKDGTLRKKLGRPIGSGKKRDPQTETSKLPTNASTRSPS